MDVEIFKPTIASLDDVEPEMRGGYVLDEAGGFRLHPLLEEDRKRYQREWDEMEANHAAKLAALDARIAKRDGILRSLAVSGGLRRAVEAAGVSHVPVDVAVAYLTDKLPVRLREGVRGDYEVDIEGPLGPLSLRQAVDEWLASPDGASYQPPAAPRDGPFLRLVRGME